MPIEPRNPFETPDLLDQFSTRSCRKGMQLISLGDSRQTVYYVLDGAFGATMYSEQGKKLSLGRMVAGDTFGELSAIDGLGRAVSVEALTDAEVLCVEQPAFIRIVMSNPDYTLWLLERVTTRLREMTNKVFELSVLSARECLLSELYRIAESTSDAQKNGYSKLPTHSELASRIGSSRETISREIANLAHDRAIEVEGRTFRVLKEDQIQHAW